MRLTPAANVFSPGLINDVVVISGCSASEISYTGNKWPYIISANKTYSWNHTFQLKSAACALPSECHWYCVYKCKHYWCSIAVFLWHWWISNVKSFLPLRTNSTIMISYRNTAVKNNRIHIWWCLHGTPRYWIILHVSYTMVISQNNHMPWCLSHTPRHITE